MEIIYIITYKCNLRCTYCPVKKKNISISSQVINSSLKLFKRKIEKVKFFGGEPLLEFSKLKKLVTLIKAQNPAVKFYLTTNGLLLDKEKFNWLKKNKINLTISLDGNEFTQLKNRRGSNSYKKIIEVLGNLPSETVFNVVIAPNTAKYFYYNFRYLVEKLGIRRFNILPAYYSDWTSLQLKVLARNLSFVLKYIKSNSLKNKLFLKNFENFSDLTFFNRALVIDCDGQIYNTNAFLVSQLETHKENFRIGDVKTIKDVSDLKNNKLIAGKLDQFVSRHSLEINRQLDEILNNFIYKYKK